MHSSDPELDQVLEECLLFAQTVESFYTGADTEQDSDAASVVTSSDESEAISCIEMSLPGRCMGPEDVKPVVGPDGRILSDLSTSPVPIPNFCYNRQTSTGGSTHSSDSYDAPSPPSHYERYSCDVTSQVEARQGHYPHMNSPYYQPDYQSSSGDRPPPSYEEHIIQRIKRELPDYENGHVPSCQSPPRSGCSPQLPGCPFHLQPLAGCANCHLAYNIPHYETPQEPGELRHHLACQILDKNEGHEHIAFTLVGTYQRLSIRLCASNWENTVLR